jgi:hypothetical protein
MLFQKRQILFPGERRYDTIGYRHDTGSSGEVSNQCNFAKGIAGLEDSERQLLSLLVFDVNPHFPLDQNEHCIGIITLSDDHDILPVGPPNGDIRKRVEASFIEGVIRDDLSQEIQHSPVCFIFTRAKLHHFLRTNQLRFATSAEKEIPSPVLRVIQRIVNGQT